MTVALRLSLVLMLFNFQERLVNININFLLLEVSGLEMDTQNGLVEWSKPMDNHKIIYREE